MAIVYGRVPKPPIVQRILSNSEAVEGYGWDNLGKRNPKFIALHRMVGTLWGTDSYFRDPDVASLTDFGIGIESVDGPANAGKIIQWNDYKGYRSGWASGKVSAPYGDGKAIVDKYGINAVNRDGVSVEVSGTNQPLDAKSWNELVKLCSFLADEMKVPYTSLPKNPHTGINLLIWHQEFTIGTGKTCPFQWLMDNTDRLYRDMAAYMKQYQEVGATPPPPDPAPPAKKAISVNWFVPLREAPGFAGKITRSKVEPYVKGFLLEGPIDKDGVKWYKVEFTDIGTGWVPDRITRTLNLT